MLNGYGGTSSMYVGRSSTGSEGIGKHLKRRKGEGVETKNICDVEGLQCTRSRGDL